jgi:hypothetical protein
MESIIFQFAIKLLYKLLPLVSLKKMPQTNIVGEWQSFDKRDDGTEELVGTMHITQTKRGIEATVTRQRPGSKKEFNYKGTCVSGQLVLIWSQRGAEDYNIGTMMLRLSGNIDTLEGYTTYFHHDTGKVISQPKVYKRLKQ